MKIIFGLGNPGKEYINTRHNIGFQLLDFICNKKNISFLRNKFNAEVAEYIVDNDKVLLVKPLSYMNLSGSVISKFVSFYKVDLDDILVIHDDLDLEFGKVKFVYNSSSGGHNGIKDIERCLGTRDYLRLKIGISNNKDIETKDYVLGKFTEDELNVLLSVDKNLVNVIDDFCTMDRNMLMNKYNRK
ncbi:MAG: aminoacyl-tRNA hydrolase [Bacilli bacterium]|nr:aminoacyl-tRNA hydrolase [Bacilli bacterium]